MEGQAASCREACRPATNDQGIPCCVFRGRFIAAAEVLQQLKVGRPAQQGTLFQIISGLGSKIFQNFNLTDPEIRTRHHIHHTEGADMHACGGANRGAGIKMRGLQRDATSPIGPGDGIATHLLGLFKEFRGVTRPIAMF